MGEQRSGFMGTFSVESELSSLGVAFGLGPRSMLYPMNILDENEIINDSFRYHRIVVAMNPSTRETGVFSRRVGQKVLTFEPISHPDEGRPLMMDHQTKSLWVRSTGKAIKGPLEGKKLDRKVSVIWRINRWKDIYRKGQIYSLKEDVSSE
jgi:hypothetical protein